MEKADSSLTIEFFPESIKSQKILLLIDFERIPTHKRYMYAALAADNTSTTTWNSKGGKD